MKESKCSQTLSVPLSANMVLLNQANISLVDPEEECSFVFYISSLSNVEHLFSALSVATYLLTFVLSIVNKCFGCDYSLLSSV